MTDQWPDPSAANFPAVSDDDSPEREQYPEPQQPPLPADTYVGADEFGTTPNEETEGEPLSDRLERELPDPAQDPSAAEGREAEREDAGDTAAPRLVAPDAGMREDTEKDAVAAEADVAGDATAEEAAVRVHENP